MRESRTYGFVRGAHSDMRPYRDPHYRGVLGGVSAAESSLPAGKGFHPDKRGLDRGKHRWFWSENRKYCPSSCKLLNN